MKIQFISNYSQLYGANRSLLTLIEYFHNNNYQVNVLLPSNGTMALRLKEKGIPFSIVPYYSAFLYIRPKFKHILVPILAILNLLTFPILIFKIKKFNPDIIYSNTSAENLGIFIAKFLRIKHITHIREFMSLDHSSFFIFGRVAKRKYINFSDGVIFVSNSVSNKITLNKELTTSHAVIYNGLNAPLKIIAEKELPQNPNFGIVGILDPGKGQHIAIEYFSKLLVEYPHSRLHIFGDKNGKYKKHIEGLVEKLKIEENVIFHGFINNVNNIYNFVDILLMFSRSEGFGRVTVEAMLRGIPVIGYDNAGTAELISNKITGGLFSNYESFKESVHFILNSSENYNKIRLNAFTKINELCNETKYCQNVENFIGKVLNVEI